MKGKRTVLYCTHLRPSGLDVLEHNSPMYSRFQQLRGRGLDLVLLGRSETGRVEKRVSGNLRICYADLKSSGRDLAAAVRDMFPECGQIPLVVARELPTARYALRVARALQCSAYYESLETWTGYHVRDGKRVFPDYYRWYLREKLVIRRFRRIIAHSFPARDYLKRLYRLKDDQIGVVYSALPVPEGDGSFASLSSVGPSDRLIVCSGGFSPLRGLEELVACFAFVPEGYKLLLAGDGPLKGKLEQMVRDKNLQGRVLFQGNVPVDQYYQLIKKADIGIDFRNNSLLNYDLNMTCRAIDYINCGVPVISGVTQCFRDIEKRLGVVKCMSPGLSPQQQGQQIARYADEFLDNPEQTRQRLQHAMDTEFSFEVNARKIGGWLSEDGIA